MSLQTLEKATIDTSSVSIGSELMMQQDLGTIDATPNQSFCFSYHLTDTMMMGAERHTVGCYLDAHQGWFSRCAHPMQVNPLGANGYAITIGKFNSCGYLVEPKIGLELSPQQSDVYRIATIDIPGYTAPGYEVSFNAQMRLVDAGTHTKVDWDLDLKVYIQFPKFIYKLPKKVIQATGDKVLKQIVTQVSRRLTHKVQQDFHTNLGLKIPKN